MLHKVRTVSAVVAAVVLSGVAAWGATPPADGGGGAQELVNRLNSTNPAEREAAQKQAAVFLDLLGQPEALKKLSEVATDENMKEFLRTRAAQLKMYEEGRRVASLPPISMKVKDATLPAVVDAFNKALGLVGVEVPPDTGFSDLYTIDATNKPFWEVYAELHQQHPITLALLSGPNPSLQLRINRTSPTAIAIDGPALGYVNSISVQRSISGAARQATLNVSSGLAFDPRLNVARLQTPSIIKAVDDRGVEYPLSNPGSGGLATGTTIINGNAAPMQQRNHMLAAPPEMGKKLSFTLATTVDINIVVGKNKLEDIEHKLNQPVILGNNTFRVTKFEVVPNAARTSTAPATPRINVTITHTEGAEPRASDAPKITSSQLVIFDSTGRSVWRGSATNSGSALATFNAATPPYRLEMSDIAGVASLPVRLQFKDVPLP